MATRRHYTAEFKLEVVNMVIDQNIAISKLSKDLSISDNLIRRWVKQYQLEQHGSVLQGTIPLTPDHEQYIAQESVSLNGKIRHSNPMLSY